MTVRSLIASVFQQKGLNFWLTNRIPRRAATSFMGWFSKIEQPLVRDLSIAVWRIFCDLDLSEAKKTQFKSLHDCFTRELEDGARPIDPDRNVLVSPCDAIVGACGAITGTDLLQVKGSWYSLDDLLGDHELAEFYRDGCFATLRLTAAMYHRFHAPCDCRVEQVTHIWGDTWNVNPIALERVPTLYCRNERVLIRTRLPANGYLVTLVPVAAILVAGIRLRFLDLVVDPRRSGSIPIPCVVSFKKGEETGWFEHGSTIIVLAPAGFALSEAVRVGGIIRMGEALMPLPGSSFPGPADGLRWSGNLSTDDGRVNEVEGGKALVSSQPQFRESCQLDAFSHVGDTSASSTRPPAERSRPACTFNWRVARSVSRQSRAGRDLAIVGAL